MAGDTKDEGGASLNVSVSKEIDAALGDVIRGLLKKPAEEAGNLLADGIGILGDRVRRKRLLNIHLGLENTRTILKAKSVELKDITPPSEEELHVVLDGMSVSGDEHVRKLWSGLLASALSPEGNQNIDRPISSAIASLSPADAMVIEFAAFVTKENRAIQQDAERAAGVESKRFKTYGDISRVKEAREAMGERLTVFIEHAAQMEKEFELPKVSAQPDWSDNLARLGIIRPRPDEYSPASSPPSIRGIEVDGRDFSEIIKYVESRIDEAEGLALEGLEIEFLSRLDPQEHRIWLGFELTRFGEKLCNACSLL